MNTYAKYAPNVFVAKCPEKHHKGESIKVTTKRGDEHDCIIHNLVATQNSQYYYSVVRSDGFNSQARAKRKADRLSGYASSWEKKSDHYWRSSNRDSEFLTLGEPIKVGHHSEKRHRKIIEQARNNTRKMSEAMDKAKSYDSRIEYWQDKGKEINLSMPESLEYYETMLEKAKKEHQAYKSGSKPKEHAFSMTYAKKRVNEMEKNLKLATKLWAD